MSLPEVALWPEELRNGKILVCHQGAVGDLILALPAIKTLRHALQPAWLEMLGHPWTLALVHGYPYADAIMDINRADMAPLFHEEAPLAAGMQGYLKGFDAAFCFSRSGALVHNLRRAGIRQVFTLAPFPDKRMHVIDHHLSSLRAFGIAVAPTSPTIYLHHEDRQEAEQFLRNQGWDLTRIVALHPGAGSRKKAWPATRFAALARALARQSHKILIIEGPADEKITKEVLKGLADIPYLLVQDLPITRLAALLSVASFFIGNDSGVSHLAAALKRPTIAIFGPTDPYIWAPRNNNAFWLQGQAACAPCTGDAQRSCKQPYCLDSITVEAVMALIAEKELLHHTTSLPDARAITIQKPIHPYGEKGISLSPP
jgi:ADP-heptose:LPS heptosyltransferase